MNRGSRAVVAALLLCGACSVLPPNAAREPSFAFVRPEATALGTAFTPQLDAHPGESGFVPVLAGVNAFLLRAAMAGLAEHTLDLQYYIWEDDLTGRLMLREALHAAERGVRVRLLLDDTTSGHATDIFALADAHPRVEVRVFNPFAQRGDDRVAGWVLDGARLNHRMHNKLMVADNAVAITGGRNIGNHYFAVDESLNFRDLDLLAVGPIVQELSSMFDLYWNSEWAYPIGVIDRNHYTADDAQDLARRLRVEARDARLPFPLDDSAPRMRERLLSFRPQLAWGKAFAIFDVPARVGGEDAMRGVADVLFDSAEGVHRELLIETAYFIPGNTGVDLLRSLVMRGVDVTVLTNSLATNDVAAAHAGYMDYRKPLLEAGVNLHELRPDAIASRRNMTVLASESVAALHTKALVYDRRTVFVGSFNLDPRSLLINTEMGVLVHSEELAHQVADMIGEGLRPANSYRLELHDGELRWRTATDDGPEYLDAEPETGWWERFVARLLSLLPIDGQL